MPVSSCGECLYISQLEITTTKGVKRLKWENNNLKIRMECDCTHCTLRIRKNKCINECTGDF